MTSPNPQTTFQNTILTNLPDSDQDNAKLLVDKHKDSIRYCTDSKTWFAWKGNKWIMDQEANIVANYWSKIASNMQKTYKDANGNDKVFAHRKYSLSYRGSQATVNTAKRDSRIQILQSEFDSNPFELNTPEGVVDLTTATLNNPNKASLHTKETNYTPDFSYPPERWITFLKQTFQGDQEIIDFMQRLMGLSLIGKVVEQIMPFAYGPPQTGKSTFFETMQALLGDYATTKDSELLMKGSDVKETIATLQGVRMVTMSETNQNVQFNAARVKTLTGNDSVEGKHLYKASFSYKPAHTFFLFGNYKPVLSDNSGGVTRRLKLIPFVHEIIQKSEREMQDILIEEEAPQILAWVIQGTYNYLQTGLRTPQSIEDLTKEYARDEDVLGQFIDEKCVVEENAKSSYENFREHYVDWCNANGYKPLGRKQLTQQLTSFNKYGKITTGKLNRNTRGYIGINAIYSSAGSISVRE